MLLYTLTHRLARIECWVSVTSEIRIQMQMQKSFIQSNFKATYQSYTVQRGYPENSQKTKTKKSKPENQICKSTKQG